MSQQKAEEEVLNQIRCAFEKMDKDGNGKVDSMELREFVKQIPDFGSVGEALCEIDTSDDGKISFDELEDFILHKCRKEDIKECHVRRLFHQVDCSHDGKINKVEFSDLLIQYNFGQEEIDAMMTDIGGEDGLISEQEFIESFKKSS